MKNIWLSDSFVICMYQTPKPGTKRRADAQTRRCRPQEGCIDLFVSLPFPLVVFTGKNNVLFVTSEGRDKWFRSLVQKHVLRNTAQTKRLY